jgi:lipopolysaccharide export system permease protein
MKTTLHKYIFHEIWPSFLAVLMVFVFIVMAKYMLDLSEWVINQGVHFVQVIKLISYLLPDIILFALPASTLIAVFVAFLRLSSSNEILAMKSSGISLFQILPTVLLVSLASSLIAMALGLFGSPWANRSFKDLAFQIMQKRATLEIKERIFFQPFDNLTFYINSYSSREKIMRDVFMADRRDPMVTKTIFAKEAQILSDPKSRTLTVVLRNGTTFFSDKDLSPPSYRPLTFGRQSFSISTDDMVKEVASRAKDPKEMFIMELMDHIKRQARGGIDYNTSLIKLLEKFSIPLAVFLMGMIGLPLGAQLRAAGQTIGIVVGLIVFLLYYLFMAGVKNLCETGTVSPVIGVWGPDVFLSLSCLYLWYRAVKEHPYQFLENMRFKWENRHRRNYGMAG